MSNVVNIRDYAPTGPTMVWISDKPAQVIILPTIRIERSPADRKARRQRQNLKDQEQSR